MIYILFQNILSFTKIFYLILKFRNTILRILFLFLSVEKNNYLIKNNTYKTYITKEMYVNHCYLKYF